MDLIARSDVNELSALVVDALGPVSEGMAAVWAGNLRAAAKRVCPDQPMPGFTHYTACGAQWFGCRLDVPGTYCGDTGVGFKNGHCLIRVSTAYAGPSRQRWNGFMGLLSGKIGAGRPDWYFGYDKTGYLVISQGGHVRNRYGEVGGYPAITAAIADLFANTLPHF